MSRKETLTLESGNQVLMAEVECERYRGIHMQPYLTLVWDVVQADRDLSREDRIELRDIYGNELFEDFGRNL